MRPRVRSSGLSCPGALCAARGCRCRGLLESGPLRARVPIEAMCGHFNRRALCKGRSGDGRCAAVCTAAPRPPMWPVPLTVSGVHVCAQLHGLPRGQRMGGGP